MALTTYTVTIEGVLRTLTINDPVHASVATATLSTDCDAVGTAIRAVITGGSLTPKSLHGFLKFSNVAGRTLGGQATYSTTYDPATPTVLQHAVANTVEPEHRASFALSPVDLASGAAISAALQAIINQCQYEGALYKHTAKVDD